MSTVLLAESALLALIRSYNSGATFGTTNSAIDDWRVLDAEDAGTACVIELAGPSQEADELNGRSTHGAYQELHRIGAWVCIERGVGTGGDVAAKQACQALVEALKDYCRPYERLNTENDDSPIVRAQIVETTDLSYIAPTDDITQATHVAQRITWLVHCEANYDPLESAL